MPVIFVIILIVG